MKEESVNAPCSSIIDFVALNSSGNNAYAWHPQCLTHAEITGKFMSITIRQARPEDATAIYAMIYELAVYEKAPEEVVTTPDEIRETLFGAGSKTEALICEVEGKIAGYAVFFTSYSTWLGRNGIYMEDLYVSPDFRGKGAGKAMLKIIAQYAVQRQCGRLEWSVLDWNQPAIDFYLSIGALPQSEWVRYRLDGDALLKFAE